MAKNLWFKVNFQTILFGWYQMLDLTSAYWRIQIEFRKFFDLAKQMTLILLRWKHCIYEIKTKFYNFNNDFPHLIFSVLLC